MTIEERVSIGLRLPPAAAADTGDLLVPSLRDQSIASSHFKRYSSHEALDENGTCYHGHQHENGRTRKVGPLNSILTNLRFFRRHLPYKPWS